MDIKMAGFLGALVSFSLILLFQSLLVGVARKRAAATNTHRDIRFMDLIITCEDDSYSLSRIQMYLWTVAIVVGYWAVFVAAPGIPAVPDSLYMLMGVNFANAVAATAITTYKTPTPAVAAKTPPDFLKYVFFDAPDSLDLPRTQMFIWTVVSLGVYVIALANSFKGTPTLPAIPQNLVVLMGISNGAYLGAKAAKKQ